MKRNSTTIFIESPGANTSLPWFNNAPDFTGFTDPTFSVLQAAWESGKANIEIIPDPVPLPLEADWEALTNALAGTSVFGKAIGTQNPNGFTLLMQSLTSLHNEAHLQYSIQLVRQGLEEDFTVDELIFINQLLENNHFLTRLS